MKVIRITKPDSKNKPSQIDPRFCGPNRWSNQRE